VAGFFIENFGCRAARADGEAVSARLCSTGLDEQSLHDASLVIVNTCSVTADADRAARAFIRRAHRRNPEAKIVVTGCYAQRAPEELAGMAGVAAVVGNSHKGHAPEIIRNLALGQVPAAVAPIVSVSALLRASKHAAAVWVDDRFAHSFIEDAPLANPALRQNAQTRPNLKIQEGCGNRCSFCVIPFTRGPSKSLSRAVILRQVEGFVEAGGKELVLSGINLGRWGRELPGAERDTLPHLVRAILEKTALPLLRLSSIEPMDWDDELIALMREFGESGAGRPRLARHAHLPLQSGSDAVLRRMHRRYRPWHYAEKFAALVRTAGPDLTVGADVMAGFPAETDREFEETLGFIRALPFGYLHLFPFSPRPGTAAWSLHAASPVPQAIVDERMAVLRAVAAEKTHAHRSRLIGRTLPSITLHTPPGLAALGRTAALTDNFIPVELDGTLPANHLMPIEVTALNGDGTLVGNRKPVESI